MKPITIRFWVPDNAPEAPADSYMKLSDLNAWLTALGTLQDPPHMGVITDEELVKIADGIAEREYRDTVSSIVEDLKRAVRDGEVTDSDGAIEWLEQTIDGHHDVIYTHCAQEILRQSRNDGAYFEDFGCDGALSDGAIEWSKLAYCALRADVLEAIGDLDEWFQCSDCNGDVTPEDIKAAGDNLPTCADCRGDSDDDDETEEDSE